MQLSLVSQRAMKITLEEQKMLLRRYLDLRQTDKDLAEKLNYGNLMFALVNSPIESFTENRIVWLVYVDDNESVPPSRWYGGFIWISEIAEGFVVLVRSNGPQLTISVYSTDLKQNLGTFPLSFNPINFELLPKPSANFISRSVASVSDAPGCQVNRIYVFGDSEQVLTQVNSEHQSCRPTYFRYDIKNKEWSRVVFREDRNEKSQLLNEEER